MKVRKCLICKQVREIVFQDYDRKFKIISICFDCAEFCNPLFQDYLLNFESDLNKMVLCLQCKNKFLLKQTWQKICINCWLLNKSKKVKQIPFFIQTKLS